VMDLDLKLKMRFISGLFQAKSPKKVCVLGKR
jgi:hypothetical protein